jgi:hypothetical protein
MTKPSWQDFGTHDESACPELWDGVVGAWCPSLGPTGLRLHDHSRFVNWGTLSNMDPATDWVVSGGQYSLDFDGTNDRVTTSSEAESLYDFSDATSKFTISLWAQDRSSTARSSTVLAKGTGASADGGWYIDLGQDSNGTDATQGSAAVYFGSGRWTGVNFSWAANVIQHLAIVVDMTLSGTGRVEAYVNGAKTGTKFSQLPLTAIAANNNPITIGNTTTNNLPFDGQVDDIRIYNRALSANDIRQLYLIGRGGMYERRRRTLRRVAAEQAGFKAYWARRQNQIIGGGV